jgi:Tfp pilus assembly protein FimT
MDVNRKRALANSSIDQQGFTLLQVIVIIALIAIVTTFGAMGVVNARAHMRLASSARVFAGLAEKARGDSVRRHALGAEMANLQLLSANSYTVTMDFDGNGVIDATDTRTFNLEPNINFANEYVGTSITFDWRGRSVTGQVTPVMRLSGPATGAAIIMISGSGDITLDSERFPDGSITDVVLNGDPTGDIRPDPPPNPNSTPTPTPDPNATPLPTPTPTPTPHGNGSPTPTPTPDPNATPTPAPTPTPCSNNGADCRTPTPTPTPSTGPCTLTATPSFLTLGNKGTSNLILYVANSSGPTTVSLTSNTNSSHISVTLASGQAGIVPNGSGTVIFTVGVTGKNQSGVLTFTASSPCGASVSVHNN